MKDAAIKKIIKPNWLKWHFSEAYNLHNLKRMNKNKEKQLAEIFVEGWKGLKLRCGATDHVKNELGGQIDTGSNKGCVIRIAIL